MALGVSRKIESREREALRLVAEEIKPKRLAV